MTLWCQGSARSPYKRGRSGPNLTRPCVSLLVEIGGLAIILPTQSGGLLPPIRSRGKLPLMPDDYPLLDQMRSSPAMSMWQALARGLGVAVVAIVLALPREVIVSSGAMIFLPVCLAGLLVLVNILGYAELAASNPRSAGVYGLVRDVHGGGWLAFLAGWVSVLAGVGLSALLVQGASRYVGLLLEELLSLTVPPNALAMGVVALAALGSRLRTGGGYFLSLVLLLVVIVAGFALLIVPRVNLPRSATVAFRPGASVPAMLAAFVGLEITAGRREEIGRRAHWLPITLLAAPLLAAAIGAMTVSAAAVSIGLQEEATSGTQLALVGQAVAGRTGLIAAAVLGSLVLVMSVSQVVSMLVRDIYGISRDGYWPAWLHEARLRPRVPTRLLLVAGLLVGVVVWIPGRSLSRVGGLLYLLGLMAANLTLFRRSDRPNRGDAGSRFGFALPFHPWIPGMVLGADLLVVPLWGLIPVAVVTGCVAVGGLIYLVYGRTRYIEAQNGVTVFRPAQERAPGDFRVLVPIANPATASALLRMAGHLARSQGGAVLALQVVVVPEPAPLDAARGRAQTERQLMERALAQAAKEDLPVVAMVRVARSVAQGILQTGFDERASLILLGRRDRVRGRASLGSVVETVLRDARCDVVVVRGRDTGPVSRILVPTAGGPHARAAARLAMMLANAWGAFVTLVYVQTTALTAEQVEDNQRRLADTLDGLPDAFAPEMKTVLASDVAEGIVREANAYDLVLMGVSDESLLDRLVFGSVSLRVAARAPATVLVQGYRGFAGIWVRKLLRALRAAVPILDTHEQLEVRQVLDRAARPGSDFFVLIVLSCMIAALGLLLDSPSVVIGAMLVAPLMSPVMAFSLGLVLGELRLIRYAIEAIFKGVALVLMIAALIGFVSPLRSITGEMLASSRPNLLDLAVALVAGIAGAYALARKDVSAALPGVAIASALTPPLATVGLSLSLGDARTAGGGLLLFAANIAAISLAGGVVFLALGIRPRRWGPESRLRLRQRLLASVLLLFAVAVPLGVIMDGIVKDTARESLAWEIISAQVEVEGSRVTALEMDRTDAGLLILVTVHSVHTFDREVLSRLADALSERLRQPVQLRMVVLPVISSE